MTTETKKTSGIIILTVPTIVYGGYFLLTVLSGQHGELGLTDFQKSMFRAGHAHAGVLIILALVAQLFVDQTSLSNSWKRVVRITMPLAAVLISGGFFASATGQGLTQPNSLIAILYAGIVVFVTGLITLGLGLLRK
jgi:hypothetical protein